MTQTMDDFEINSEDATITFSKDGTINLFLPKIDGDRTVDPNEDPHVFTAVAIMTLFNDPRLGALIDERISALLNQAEAMESGGGCCGGCKTETPEEGCTPDKPGCTGCGSNCADVEEDTDDSTN